MDISRTREFPVLVHWQQPRCLLGAGASEIAAPQAAAMGLKHGGHVGAHSHAGAGHRH
ncbi:MAG: hypothetical protein ACR2LY_02115 [Thermoleophilaceae bacterium]